MTDREEMYGLATQPIGSINIGSLTLSWQYVL